MDESQCCVCYSPTYEFTPCAHPLCRACCIRLDEAVCPLCRQTLSDFLADAGGNSSNPAPEFLETSAQTSHQRSLRHAGSDVSLTTRQLFAPGRQIVTSEIDVHPSHPPPDGPISSRQYLRRSWLRAGLPVDANMPSAGATPYQRPQSVPVVARRARRRRVVTLEAAHGSVESEQAPGEHHHGMGGVAAGLPVLRHEATSGSDRKQWHAWSLPGFPSVSAVASMDSRTLLEQVDKLVQLEHAVEQRRCMAQALAERARQLASTAKSLDGGTLHLRSVVYALHESGLLGDREAEKHLRYSQKRAKLLKEGDLQLLKLRGCRSGISGQPLARRSLQLDRAAETLVKGALDLKSAVHILHKSGLLKDEEAQDHSRYLDNRISELNQFEVPRQSVGQCHNGLSGWELEQRANRLQRASQGLEHGASCLRSNVHMLYQSGFVAHDEAAEHTHSLDAKISKFKEIRANVLGRSSLLQRGKSLPRLL